MSTDDNVRVVKRLWSELNKGNLNAVDECFADNCVGYTHDGKVIDRNTYKMMLAALRKAYPDVQAKEEGMVASGDMVALRFATIGTDTVGSAGKPPTGKRMTLQQAYFMRFSGGKIVELQSYYGPTRLE